MFSQRSARLNRRDALRSIGSMGVMATLAAGAASVLGADPALARTQRSRARTHAGQSGKVYRLCDGKASDCCTTCYRAEGHCGHSHCPNNGCCYHCDGCGVVGYLCFNNSCVYSTVTVCN